MLENEPKQTADDTGKGGRVQPAPVLFVAPEAAPAAAPVDDRAPARQQTRSKSAAKADKPAATTRKRASRPEGPPDEVPAPAEVAEQAPAAETPVKRTRRSRKVKAAEAVSAEPVAESEATAEDDDDDQELGPDGVRRRRRRGRRGRGRGKGASDVDGEFEDEPHDEAEGAGPQADDADDDSAEAGDGVRRRRRRRRRSDASDGGEDSPVEPGTDVVVKVRKPRPVEDEVQGLSGSTRLAAKRQRRRDGRGQHRTRPQILTESEFLARREAVDRQLVIRQLSERTQIAVLEDGVLVEHYVTRSGGQGMSGNVYLGKVQNVLPSMEAAFVDIGRGRNAVLYAGEVQWDRTGLAGRARSIEQAMKSGDSVLVQVTKDPMGHKGARLTNHIALSGRHLVYVPNGNASGISRKLPDTERRRLRSVLKKLVPEGAGVIVRTAAEGASEDELARDIERLKAQWEEIEGKVSKGGAPVLLYQEPDLVTRVVRDVFNEDFRELIVDTDEAYDEVRDYLSAVSPDLLDRLHRHSGKGDVFADLRIEEQLLKALDRKVFLPSGGHLVLDRTEAMTVIDVNTGKFTGEGGNLEETVTRNNLEAAEEIVRQLRLRDIGGIVVIDFIDMVLEANRDLVLRRLTECLGRDRTKHQVTEITSLGLVQMTRKRIGQGLLEAFSEVCEHCKGRGVIVHLDQHEKHGGGGGGNGQSQSKGGGRQQQQQQGGGKNARAEKKAERNSKNAKEAASEDERDAGAGDAAEAVATVLAGSRKVTEPAQ